MKKYMVRVYKDSGIVAAQLEFDDFRAALEILAEFNKTCKRRPSIWVFDGAEYQRVHDFNFYAVTDNNITDYLRERILDTDELLANVEI